MTDTETTLGLTAPAAPPTNATEASNRLGTLTGDKEWSAKLLAGDVATRREFDELAKMAAEGDKIDAAMAGVVPDLASGVLPDGSLRLMANTAATLRESGISDAAIRQVLSNQPVSKEEHAAVTVWRRDRMSNPEWTKRYLAGDQAAVREMTLANIVISSDIKTEARP